MAAPKESSAMTETSAGGLLLNKVAVPALFIGIGYLLGFFHGKSRKKES